MKKSLIFLGVVMTTITLVGCQKSSDPNEQAVNDSIDSSTGKIMENDQTIASHSVSNNDFEDIPEGNLSEDDPIFDSVEENIFIGEVLEVEKRDTVLAKVKINDTFQECYIPIGDQVEVREGQVIKVKTNGIVLETFPASFAEVFSVEVIK